MKRDIKQDIKKRARIAAGIVNILTDDIERLKSDANNFDVLCLEESLKDARTTLQMLCDHVTEMEYMLYMYKKHY